jgi:hypothetical protein
MSTSELTRADHPRRFTVTRIAAGWEVREEYERDVVRTTTYMDWHRVERAMELFKLAAGGRLQPAGE